MMGWLVAALFSVSGAPMVQSLLNSQVTSLAQITGPGTVAVFYQSNCPSCFRLIQDLSCLNSQNIVLFGAFSAERALRKEYRKFQVHYPAYWANQEILTTLGVSAELTPQVLYFGQHRRQLFYGYRKCSEYKKLFRDHDATNG